MLRLFIIELILFLSIVSSAQYRDPVFAEVEVALNNSSLLDAKILCPEDYAYAMEHYNTAKQLSFSNAVSTDIREELEQSIIYITRMNDYIDRNHDLFETVLESRKNALSSGAAKFAEAFWRKAEDNLADAVNEINDGSEYDAKEIIPFADEYYTLSTVYADKANYLLMGWEVAKKAQNSLANILAPSSYINGFKYLSEALDMINDGDGEYLIDQVKDQAANSFSIAVTKAEEFANMYPEIINSREDALKVKAELYAPEFWTAAEKYLKLVTAEFEDQNYSFASENSLEAVGNYITAKRESEKEHYLADAEAAILNAEEEEADYYAPKTYNLAVEYLNDARSIIYMDQYDVSDVIALARKSQNESLKAAKIALLIKRIDSGDSSLEDIVMNWPEVTGLQSAIQIAEIPVPVIIEPAEEYTPITEFYAEEETAIEETADLDDLFGLFTAGEANVSENNEQFVINLIGLEFGPLDLLIDDKDQEILKKTIKAIESFPNSGITIVGNTDNIGVKSDNQILSEKRAERIYKYIVKNSSILPSRLSLRGDGEINPISENRSFEGRLKNRRVDILIKK